MNIEGFFSLSRKVVPKVPSNEEIEIFNLPNGYISFPKQQANFDFVIFAKLQSNLLSISSRNKIRGDISFCDIFSPLFKKSSLDSLGLGVWYNEFTESIHLYRDSFGQIPLYYIFIPGSYFAFSSSLTSLLRLQDVRGSLTLNLETIFQFSKFAEDSRQYYSENTFYNQIKVALPGHITSIEGNSISHHIQLQFNISKWDHLTSLQEYGEEFNALFRNSIKTQVSDYQVIGSHLSGGLDSSSISAVTKSLFPSRLLHTLYATTKTKAAEESGYSRLVADRIGSIHHEVEPSNDHIQFLILYTSLYGHPEKMVLGSSFQGTLMEYAKNLGSSLLLIGHPGDTIVGTGFDILTDTYHAKDWSLLNTLLKQRALNANHSSLFEKWDSFSEGRKLTTYTNYYLYRELPRLFKKSTLKEFLVHLVELRKQTGFSLEYLVNKVFQIKLRSLWSSANSFTNLLRDDLVKHETEYRSSEFSKHKSWSEGIFTTQAIGFNEELHVLGNHYDIRNSLPFYNKGLYELSLAVPNIIKFDKGRGRGHLRAAMAGTLPDAVINRTDKAKFGIYNNEVALQLYRQSLDFLNDSNDVWDYIDQRKFLKALKVIQSQKDRNSPNALLIIRAISLSVWLHLYKNNGFR